MIHNFLNITQNRDVRGPSRRDSQPASPRLVCFVTRPCRSRVDRAFGVVSPDPHLVNPKILYNHLLFCFDCFISYISIVFFSNKISRNSQGGNTEFFGCRSKTIQNKCGNLGFKSECYVYFKE